MTYGPVMLDVEGLSLTAEDRERVQHPLCGGVILFARNYESWEQVSALVQELRSLGKDDLLISVDQEGGRVQRFRDGFLDLPPMRVLGDHYDISPQEAVRLANQLGWAMASEVLAVGVDFSFAPVLDLDYGESAVIGDRAIHEDPQVVTALARSYIWGMKKAGMSAVGKHFPGHGFVTADSHTHLPVDERPFSDIEARDLLPFSELSGLGLEGVMPAHVIYSACDDQPAGFSRFWLQEILRGKLHYEGVIFSDDLSMAAAEVAGSPLERAERALDAGCDVLLVCNNPQAADEIMQGLEQQDIPTRPDVARIMRARIRPQWDDLHTSDEWAEVVSRVALLTGDRHIV